MKLTLPVAFALLLTTTHAHAHLPVPEKLVSVGPTLAYAHARDLGTGFVYGVDAAAASRLVWASGGVRVFETFEASERRFLPYLEVGLWFIANVGVGYTLDFDFDDRNAAGPHFFAGLPLPFLHRDHDVFYVEPYYRATYADVGTLHEGGAFVKWATFE